MTAHCGWCGRFLMKDTFPTPGFNVRLEVIEQTLCPDCAPQWIELSKLNQQRYQGGADKAWSGYQEANDERQ